MVKRISKRITKQQQEIINEAETEAIARLTIKNFVCQKVKEVFNIFLWLCIIVTLSLGMGAFVEKEFGYFILKCGYKLSDTLWALWFGGLVVIMLIALICFLLFQISCMIKYWITSNYNKAYYNAVEQVKGK